MDNKSPPPFSLPLSTEVYRAIALLLPSLQSFQSLSKVSYLVDLQRKPETEVGMGTASGAGGPNPETNGGIIKVRGREKWPEAEGGSRKGKEEEPRARTMGNISIGHPNFSDFI